MDPAHSMYCPYKPLSKDTLPPYPLVDSQKQPLGDQVNTDYIPKITTTISSIETTYTQFLGDPQGTWIPELRASRIPLPTTSGYAVNPG